MGPTESDTTEVTYQQQQYSIVYMDHIFSIHSPVDGHLYCSHILPIINKVAMNLGMHVFFWISVFVVFRYIPRGGIAGSCGSYSFSFLEKPPYSFPQWLNPFTLPATEYKDSLFSTFVIFVLFGDCHSGRYEVISHIT